jgi:hypothetical protein
MGLRSWAGAAGGSGRSGPGRRGLRRPGDAGRPGSQVTTVQPKVAYANIGGYLLAYECAGTGSPIAGSTAAGGRLGSVRDPNP